MTMQADLLRIPLPSGWSGRTKSVVLQIVSSPDCGRRKTAVVMARITDTDENSATLGGKTIAATASRCHQCGCMGCDVMPSSKSSTRSS